MRAVVYDQYGPSSVLRFAEVEQPLPEDDEILIRIRATTVNRTDTGLRAGDPFFARFVTGLRRPKKSTRVYRSLARRAGAEVSGMDNIVGSEFAGEVEGVGERVRAFKVGDQVFGISAWNLGAHAEFICMREDAALAPKPAGMTFEEAAAVCDGAILALMCLRPAKVQEGTRILIYGASGSIGTAGVQLSKSFGADVTAVCNTKNLELVSSLGADRVIDYTREDFTKNGERYDVIFDAVGKRTFSDCKRSLRKGGIYVTTDGLQNIVLALWTSRFGAKRVIFPIPPRYTREDVLFLKELIETGKYRAVIDRCYPFEQIIDATKYVETKQKTGNVVLTVSSAASL
jgi:NADPH:quinone reductase-like Zn-dependent oxidoreductase